MQPTFFKIKKAAGFFYRPTALHAELVAINLWAHPGFASWASIYDNTFWIVQDGTSNTPPYLIVSLCSIRDFVSQNNIFQV